MVLRNIGDFRGAMVIVLGTGDGDEYKSLTRLFEFHIALIHFGKKNPIIFSSFIGK